jgi:putative ABC transport system substrate-binding protein
MMVRTSNVSATSEAREVEAAAKTFDIQVVPLEILSANDIAPALDALKSRADALYIVVDALLLVHAVRINTMALGARIPTMHGARELLAAGGLISYGADFVDLWRRSADYIDKILRGAKPADIPVEQPTKFELVINLATAKALGLTIPPTLLARADEVIE